MIKRVALAGICLFIISGPLDAQDDWKQPSQEQLQQVLHFAGRQVARVAAQTSPAVVHIESERELRNSVTEETGSGVLITSPRSKTPFIVTNRHVVADAELQDIRVLLSDGRIVSPYEKIEDSDSDLAVLKIRETGITPAQWGDSDNLDIGHFVLAMGSPFGLDQSVTLGIISAKGRRSLDLPGRRVINQDFLQTDAAINPGNSGGPLIDLDGRVVGINTAIASQGGGNDGIGFSIPSNLVQFIVTQLLEFGRVRRGYLGVELDEDFTLEEARELSLDRITGARVVRVLESTPAANAGLRTNDVIIDFDGIEVQDENDLINRVSLTPVNKQVRMVILRNGQPRTLSVILTEKRDLRQGAVPQLPVPAGQRVYRNASHKTQRLTPQLASQLGYIPTQKGLLVVSRDGQAGDVSDESELQLYDVIEEVARQPVTTPEEFEDAVSQIDEGPIVLKVWRISDGEPTPRLVMWTPNSEDATVAD
ncbi:Periplasmic pH-dependent serine endoprotease DegQ precursor [Thalassoglobus neptunius]|uniref:Periplasmic pH-dependent serine endoprotease DegQ n=2 Tax=Thalassoglobus neptunius TaxID=1938619 RepID=A0A5C5VWS7_9PLAN|nr:Periplasmic pH-dependent serine endoprotease DegQ precursor [Thalassoglobus neptunius]